MRHAMRDRSGRMNSDEWNRITAPARIRHPVLMGEVVRNGAPEARDARPVSADRWSVGQLTGDRPRGALRAGLPRIWEVIAPTGRAELAVGSRLELEAAREQSDAGQGGVDWVDYSFCVLGGSWAGTRMIVTAYRMWDMGYRSVFTFDRRDFLVPDILSPLSDGESG